jgi:hypothetical protein
LGIGLTDFGLQVDNGGVLVNTDTKAAVDWIAKEPAIQPDFLVQVVDDGHVSGGSRL